MKKEDEELLTMLIKPLGEMVADMFASTVRAGRMVNIYRDVAVAAIADGRPSHEVFELGSQAAKQAGDIYTKHNKEMREQQSLLRKLGETIVDGVKN